ncbi:hypothetical protein B566_EDAN018455, partial [Ephemera danica]
MCFTELFMAVLVFFFFLHKEIGLALFYISSPIIHVGQTPHSVLLCSQTMQSYNEAGLRTPTTLSRNFEHFLLCMASLYMKDELGLELSLEFWSLPESSQSLSSSLLVRAPQAQTTLNKFMQSVGDMLPPAMFVPYLKLLAALAKGPRVSKDAFTLLNSGEHDPIARVVLAEDPAWDAVHTILGLVKCSVPVPLKADLLLTLAALAKNPHVATEVWQKLEMSGVLATSELEEVEARNEEFPLSRAMVTLLSSLTEATALPLVLGIGRRTPGLEPYLHFVVDCLFLRFMHRAYRRQEEK